MPQPKYGQRWLDSQLAQHKSNTLNITDTLTSGSLDPAFIICAGMKFGITQVNWERPQQNWSPLAGAPSFYRPPSILTVIGYRV